MKYLRVKNWERFQNYSDRRPPWIRLYADLINGDDVPYNSLADASKLLLIHIWLLASRHENKIPGQIITKGRLNLKSAVNLQPLIAAGFIEWHTEEDASAALANGLQEDSGEQALARRARASVSVSVSPSVSVLEKEFEQIWPEYPKPIGRKAALRHFLVTVKTPEDVAAIRRALANYKSSDRVRRGYVQNGATWFNNWRDWENYVEKTDGNKPRSNKQPTAADFGMRTADDARSAIAAKRQV